MISDTGNTLRIFVFFNDTATTEIYTLSLHDALPICAVGRCPRSGMIRSPPTTAIGRRCRTSWSSSASTTRGPQTEKDRKSTRLNSSHANISYAVFCLKKKNNDMVQPTASHMAVIHRQ